MMELKISLEVAVISHGYVNRENACLNRLEFGELDVRQHLLKLVRCVGDLTECKTWLTVPGATAFSSIKNSPSK